MISKNKKILIGILSAAVLVCAYLILNRSMTEPSEKGSSPLRLTETVATGDSAPANITSKNANATKASSAKSLTPEEEKLQAAAEAQWHLLQEILASHNDNDPRLDKDLRVLNQATKEKFRAEYKNLPLEKRNERGTLVFLLGRNLKDAQDFAFFKEVVSESPCLSLVDCGKPEQSFDHDQEEHQNGLGVSLAYPQLVALQSLQNLPFSNDNPALKEQALDILNTARHSKILEVSRMAESIEGKLTADSKR